MLNVSGCGGTGRRARLRKLVASQLAENAHKSKILKNDKASYHDRFLAERIYCERSFFYAKRKKNYQIYRD